MRLRGMLNIYVYAGKNSLNFPKNDICFSLKIVLNNGMINGVKTWSTNRVFPICKKEVVKVCTSCSETSQIFSVDIVTKEAISNDMALYKEMAHRLFQNKVITLINIGNNRGYSVEDKQIFSFELHLTNQNHPEKVTLANVENALGDILSQFEGYSDLQVKLI